MVWFTSFSSGDNHYNTVGIPPDGKLVNPTSVHCEARVSAKLLAVTECIISILWVTDPPTLESVSSEISF